MKPDMKQSVFNILKHVSLFSSLDEEQLEKLIDHMPKIELKEGDILFKQGDPSDSLYVVIRGLLAAVVQTSKQQKKIAGKIRTGELVGEMGLFTSEPRTANIEALYPSVVLKLDVVHFKKFFGESVDEVVKISRLILNRSKKTNKVLDKSNQNNSIFLLPANKQVNTAPFYFILQQQAFKLRDNITFIKMSHIKSIINREHKIDAYLEQMITESNFTFFLADIDDDIIFDLVFSHVDSLGIIASGEEQKYISKYVEDKINSAFAKLLPKELILLYLHATAPIHASEWTRLENFHRIHHVYYKSTESDIRLIRLLTGQGIGLVLSGGGVRGWVHIGVLKALMELKIPIDEIGGVSAGAIAGAMYASSNSYEEMYAKFMQLSQAINNPYHIYNFTWPTVSLLSAKQMTVELEKIFGQQLIEDLPIHFFCVCCNLSDIEETVATDGLLWKWVRTSAAIPGLVPPVVHDGKIYLDGGVVNNLPIDVMRERLGVKGKIIAIDISPVIKSEHYYRFPPIITLRDVLFHKLGISKMKHYYFPSFQTVLLKSLLIGSLEHAKRNISLGNILIQPDLRRFPTLSSITQKQIEDMINLGYHSTISASDQITRLLTEKSHLK